MSSNFKKIINKKNIFIIFTIFIFLVFFSIIFAILNITNEKINNGVFIQKINVSNLDCNEAKEKIEDIIKNNQYAVVTMAVGQGTRLGHKGPKGTFLIDVLPEPKYLFQILAENLERANKKYGIILPWYIMTSTENNAETVKFFEEHNYFGYPKENVKFFMQGNLPLLKRNGDLIIDKDYSIKEAADGNGCIYKAMKKDGVLDDMKKKCRELSIADSAENIFRLAQKLCAEY